MHQILNYDGDLVIIGRDLTADRFKDIVADMPKDKQACVIGWRRTGNSK